MDVGQIDQVRSALTSIQENVEKVDILINNAGIARDNLLLRMKDEEWDQVLRTNLDGLFYVTREVVKGMVRQRYGRVINITSVVAQMGNPGQVNYVSSKAGIIGFTKALARELASRNITVNAIAPGFIETDMTTEMGQKMKDELRGSIPLKRLGSVGDVAYGVLFLAAKEAGYVTGHVLNINGGMYM
jgi:3-oxoacyl-[acyl-carrier protein] reductase